MGVYVVSERNSNHDVAWGTSYEFEDIIARTCDAQIVAPERWSIHPLPDQVIERLTGPHYYKIKDFEFADEPNLILLIGMGPQTIRMLNTMGQWRRKSDTVAAFIIDLYPGALKRLEAPMVNKLDYLFISYEQMLEPVRARFKTPVTFIPQACDVLGQGACGGQRPIDVVGYGRQQSGLHQAIQKRFNRRGSERVYFHTTFKYLEVKDWREDRDLFWKLMRRAKVTMAYCFIETHVRTAFGVSPLTARWFEGLAAGCVIVGRRPKSPETDRLLDWEDATIDLPNEADKCVSFLEELLNDTERLATVSCRNYLEALRRHDWRHRLKDMFEAIGIKIPDKLTVDLKKLESQATVLESSTSVSSR